MYRGLFIILAILTAAPANAAMGALTPGLENLSIFALGVGGVVLGWRSSRRTTVRRDEDA